MAKCEKCGETIKGEPLVWKDDSGKNYTSLCWPCKQPMMFACLPRALKRLKAELEAPAMQKALTTLLSDDPKDRN